MRLEDLNALDVATAVRALLRCCGSRRWAEQVAAARPFSDVEQVVARADAVLDTLDRDDWLEAFAAHPRIGEPGGAEGTSVSDAVRSAWSDLEQAGAQSATGEERERLAARNREYESRFGHVFIVCATGKSAGEMLALLQQRLTNDPVREIGIAADEQRKIAHLRLRKLLAE